MLQALLALGFASAPARAFEIGTHAAIAGRAWGAEAPQLGDVECSGPRCQAFVEGTRHEDLNSPSVKWLRFHHYYRPDAAVPTTFREGPLARIAELWGEAQEAARSGDELQAWDRVGHIAHFIQDAAAPPHVVPIQHALGDGFERAATPEVVRSTELGGAEEPPPLDGHAALDALAFDTLAAIGDAAAGALTEEGRRLPWTSFWAEKKGDWGMYGVAGNAFGSPEVEVGGASLHVPEAEYRAFVEARTASAIRFTRAFLRWAGPLLDQKGSAGETLSWRSPPQHSFEMIGGAAPSGLGGGLRLGIGLPGAFAVEGTWLRDLTGSRWNLGLSRVLGSRWLHGIGGLEFLATADAGRGPVDSASVRGGLGVRLALTQWVQLRVDASMGGAHDASWRPTGGVTTGLGLRWGDP